MTKPIAFKNPHAVVQTWQVPFFIGGIRADQYLCLKIGRLSRTSAQKLIETGDFRAQHGPLKSSRRFFGGEFVELWHMPPDIVPDNPPKVEVIFENNDFVVINKPSDLVIHPTAKYLYHTLTYWFSQKYPLNTPHPCHRLDRETSGVMLAANNSKVQGQIKTAFMKGEVEKTYLAIVQGELKYSLDIKWPLALQGNRGLVRIRMIRDDENGMPSQTLVRPLYFDPISQLSLVECRPKTGRQHQIRAHLSIEGFPIIGDKLYFMGDEYFDDFTKHKAIKYPGHFRQALHAHTIAFKLFDKNYCFTAPFPPDLKKLLPFMTDDQWDLLATNQL